MRLIKVVPGFMLATLPYFALAQQRGLPNPMLKMPPITQVATAAPQHAMPPGTPSPIPGAGQIIGNIGALTGDEMKRQDALPKTLRGLFVGWYVSVVMGDTAILRQAPGASMGTEVQMPSSNPMNMGIPGGMGGGMPGAQGQGGAQKQDVGVRTTMLEVQNGKEIVVDEHTLLARVANGEVSLIYTEAPNKRLPVVFRGRVDSPANQSLVPAASALEKRDDAYVRSQNVSGAASAGAQSGNTGSQQSASGQSPQGVGSMNGGWR